MCATYTTSGGSERGYTYSWDEAWATDGEGVASEVNVRKNKKSGFKKETIVVLKNLIKLSFIVK